MPSFMKDELKKKDRQRFEDMQKEIADVINNKADEEENQAEEEAEQSPYAADNGESQQPEVDVKNVDELEAEITKLQEAVAAEKERTRGCRLISKTSVAARQRRRRSLPL